MESFANEIRGYTPNMYRVALSILKNSSDAEDAVSESVMTALIKRGALRSVESFKPWIMKILVRECYKILKGRKRFEYREVLPDIPVSDEYEIGELWSAVCQLDKNFRIVVVLFYYEDMNLKEIAKSLSLPLGTIKSRLSRARIRLKELID